MIGRSLVHLTHLLRDTQLHASTSVVASNLNLQVQWIMSIFTRKISAIKLHAFSMYNYDKLIKQSAQKIRYVGHLSFFPFIF